MRAVAYIRVSDASQVDGHSLNAQERLFKQLCDSRGWEAVNVYREEGRSAKHDAIARRPVFRQLLEDAANGAFDIVVVHTLDRWARNLRVMLETLGTLAKHNVTLVSITEQLDYSTPQGRLMMQVLGGFAEFYSGSLSTHIKKGVEERARTGLHLGGIPFGYQSCKLDGCDPEHSGGMHLVPDEAGAVRQLFRRYAKGTTTAVQLAAWMNDQGHHTRNRHRMGTETAEPRYFTNSSVRGILHNPFYAGKVKHLKKRIPGLHKGLVSWDLFQQVQDLMRRNSGRSRVLEAHSAREYLLKGLVRCAHCGMPMWAQTYQNGYRYYREHRGTRGSGACVNRGGSVRCEVVDEQVSKVIESLVLPDDWLERALERISLKDEAARVRMERERIQEKLKRLGKAYVDNLVDEPDYERQKAQWEFELASLVVPEADLVAEAGRLVQRLPELWAAADMRERRKLLLAVLDAVYVDARAAEVAVSIRPKAAFVALLSEPLAFAASIPA